MQQETRSGGRPARGARGPKPSHAEDPCAIARALDVIGDGWSLLIVREALFGSTRFSQFQRHLGLAKTVLSVRLKKLVDADVMTMVETVEGVHEYRLTQKGEALHVVLAALWQWGAAHEFEEGRTSVVLSDRRDLRPVGQIKVRAADDRPLAPREMILAPRSARTRKAR